MATVLKQPLVLPEVRADQSYWYAQPTTNLLIGLFATLFQYYNPTPIWTPEPDPPTIWQGAPIAGNLPLLSPPASPFVASQQHVYQLDDPPPWRAKPAASWIISELTQQRFFGVGGQVPTKTWHYDYTVESGWRGSPSGNNFPLLAPSASPFFTRWRSDFHVDPAWQITSSHSGAISMLTAGGIPFVKQWRYDYEADAVHVSPIARNAALLAPSTTQPTFTQWRYDYVTEPYWQSSSIPTGQALLGLPQYYTASSFWGPDGDQTLPMWQGVPSAANIAVSPPSAAQPFFTQWRSDYPESTVSWQLASRNIALFPPVTAQPVFVQWRYDYVTEPYWQGTPQPSGQIATAKVGTPFSIQWRYDLHPEPVWLGVSVAAAQSLLASPVLYAPTPQWAPDGDISAIYWQPQFANLAYQLGTLTLSRAPFFAPKTAEHSVWQGAPVPSGQIATTVATTKPFFVLWRSDPVSEPQWIPVPATSAALKMLAAGGRPFAKQWRQDYQIDEPLWLGAPQSSEQIVSSAPPRPFAKLWRYDHDIPSVWNWQPPPPDVVRILTAGGRPAFKFWRWDHVPETIWQGSPQPSGQISSVRTIPFQAGRQRIYQFDDPPQWQGAPSHSFVIPILTAGGRPFARLWRWDYQIDAPVWQGSPLPSGQISSVRTVPFVAGQQHVYQFDDPPQWQGNPSASWIIPELTQQQIFGAGGQVPTKFWRWDHVPEPVWPASPQSSWPYIFVPTVSIVARSYLIGSEVPITLRGTAIEIIE